MPLGQFDSDPPIDPTLLPSAVIERSGTVTLPATVASLNAAGYGGSLTLLHQAMRKTTIDALDISVENLQGGSLEFTLFKVPDGVDIDGAVVNGNYVVGTLQFPITDSLPTAGVNAPVRRSFTFAGYGSGDRTLDRGEKLVLMCQSLQDTVYGGGVTYTGTQTQRAFWALAAHSKTT